MVGTALVDFSEVGLVDTSGDGVLDDAELAEQEAAIAPTLVRLVRDRVSLTVNDVEVSITGAGITLSGAGQTAEHSEYVGLAFVSTAFDGPVSQVDVGWEFTSPNTAVLVSDADGAVLGQLGDDSTVSFTFGEWSTARSFAVQGLEHIRFGPDHMAFLVVLTLGVVRSRLDRATAVRVVSLVTAFTVGHALSLCLAYLELVTIPADIVEPAIALTIVGAAALGLRRRAGNHRWWIAGVVGVVHGLGFASSLAGLGLATPNVPVALLAFNLGVDVAQMAVVGVVIAVFAVLARVLPRRTEAVRIATCIIIGALGLVWLVLRLIP